MDPRTRGLHRGYPGMKPPNAGKTFPAEVLTPGEVLRLVDACSRRGPTGLRNRAMLVAMWRGGLRVAETLALLPKDVDFERGTIAVLRGKGNKRRTIGIDGQALAVIETWAKRRREIVGLSRSAPLFCTITSDAYGPPGRSVNTAYVRDLLKRLGRNAGIEKRVHPHGLRHTHAYELAMEGTPLNLIQAQLGHSSLATTDRYVRHIAPVALVRALQARTWPDADEDEDDAELVAERPPADTPTLTLVEG